MKSFPRWFLEEVSKSNSSEILKSVYDGSISSTSKILFTCPIHGDYEQVIAYHIKRSTGEPTTHKCPICGRERKANKISEQRHREIPQSVVDNLSPNERRNPKSFVFNDKVTFLCPIHGDYVRSISDYIRTVNKGLSGCQECNRVALSNRRKANTVQYPVWFLDSVSKNNPKEVLDSLYNGTISSTEEILFICPKHGEYRALIKNRINKSTLQPRFGCPKCADMKRRPNGFFFPDWFKDIVSENNPKEVISEIENNTLSSLKKILFTCPIHGDYERQVSNVINIRTMEKKSTTCPYCIKSTHSSSYEQEIVEYLLSINPNLNIIRNTRRVISPYEVDIYLPDYNIAIEFNGSYYHASKMKESNVPTTNYHGLIPKTYHQDKYLKAQEKGIRLIHIYDVDWLANKDKYKGFLKELIIPHDRIYARKTILKEIDIKTARIFNEKYHLSGHSNCGSKNIGLFYNNELISLMSFGKNRYSKDNSVYELYRYTVKSGVTVVGGAHKLFKYFLNRYKPDKVISYSDCNYFSGGTYADLGFRFTGYTVPMYFWSLRGKKIPRERVQPKKLIQQYPDIYSRYTSGSVEDFIMCELGAFKVYTASNKKWVYESSSV